MTRSGALAIAILVFGVLPAMAGNRVPGGGGLPPLPNPQLQMQRRMAALPAAPSPYPMTYTEQVARSLGVRDGRVDLLPAQARNPYSPSVSLGGGMLRLRWSQ
jgi:hypothetical protein